MSHFVTLVFGEDVDSQMEPYVEECDDPKYLEFEDIEDSSLEEYQNKDVELVMLADQSVHSTYDQQFSFPKKDGFGTDFKYPEDSQMIVGRYTQLYATFDDFMSDYHGLDERDDKTGRYGYWRNPNAKWDWYVVGGRWSGYFKPVEGREGFLGRPGVFDNVPTEGWCDSLLLKDIDIDGMRADSISKAHATYDILEQALNGRELPSWNKVRESHGDDIEAARTEYNSNPVEKDIRDAGIFCWGDLVETYGPNREEYVKRQANSTMVPYSLVIDGKWYQRGEMGWFGCSTDEMTQDEWNTKFWELIESLPPETRITALDCHI